MGRIATIAIVILSVAIATRADILVVQNTGNTIVPHEEADISMDSETVRIDPKGHSPAFAGEYMVSCDFVLTNHSTKSVVKQIAFPIAHRNHRHLFSKGFRGSVQRNGERTPLITEIRMAADSNGVSHAGATDGTSFHDVQGYPGYVIWEQRFDPGETQIVRCDYPMGRPRAIYPGRPFTGVVFEYVVRTGALWKGRIGEATISLWFNPPSFRPDKITMTCSDSVQGNPYEGDTLVWRFTDWEPSEDIAVAFTRWTDYDANEIARNHYRLPHPYRGAEQAYTRQYLGQLAQQEILRVAEYYPEQAATVEKDFLRSMIAEYLFYELFARHGDPLTPRQVARVDRSKHRERYGFINGSLILSPWHNYFRGYSYHGGWYRYFDSKAKQLNPAVTLSDLDPTERKNAAFLKGFISRPLLR